MPKLISPESHVSETVVSEDPLALGARLRTETHDQHRSTESRTFIVRLMKGELSLADYTRYLAQMAWVYEALESRTPSESDFAIYDVRLNRLAEIESDLVALGAADWRSSHPALPSTQRYADRLRELVATDSPRYVAHHYTRYLGDLSGGQAISRLVARHYAATDEQLAFYRFDGIENHVHFKREYREQLDALPLSEEESAAVVEEALAAFEFNGALFDELQTPAVAA
ncbi:biliverdin-producing heme oxygenase [Microterricola pindariensis]|uniref:biliverdin-producing heme oxygenase n=1 Tax=Microterricola pindariensis TaxID=478010 RepID=UPI001374A655|nr:biliverdin-producing heme oxygenase [Microterricola pindariensis]